MKAKRMWRTIRLCLIFNSEKRAHYARKAGIYAGMGEHVAISSRLVPLYSELIRFHNNIRVARKVDFVTHDMMHAVFNRHPQRRELLGGADTRFGERIGCIEIMDNVFIGSHSIILYGTKIGPNVIIASGSVVTKDLAPNGVYAGVPARRIGDFDAFVRKRAALEAEGSLATTRHNQALTPEEISHAWEVFASSHATPAEQAENRGV